MNGMDGMDGVDGMDRLEIDRDGTTLSALHRPGAGAPVVVVPGIMADAADWTAVAQAIDTPRPVVVLDRRGRQPSGPLGDGYGVGTEVADLLGWIERLGPPVSVFGWSYGALIALQAAALNDRTDPVIDHVIGYEPVVRPFGDSALTALHRAALDGDLDRTVTIVNRTVSGFSEDHVRDLRLDPAWTHLRTVAGPVHAELQAVADCAPDDWSRAAIRVDLILGELNRGREPYGTSFDAVHALVPAATVSALPGQGHLAHVTGPESLGRLVGELLRGQ